MQSSYKLIVSESTCPYYNLSLEKWAMENLDVSNDQYLLLYKNTPCVVVGRNQNIFEEVNIPYCLKNNIKITRRISGGGTVFHDLGNLNWAIIAKRNLDKVNSYEWAVKPIFKILEGASLKPYLTPRNAIEIEGCKISGQAQFTNKKRVLSHGTLLVNSRLAFMQPSIESAYQNHIHSKSSKSVRSKVINISQLTPKINTVDELILEFKKEHAQYPINYKSIQTSVIETNTWIYNRSPKFTVRHHLDNQEYIFYIQKGIIVKHENTKGLSIKNSPYIGKSYLNFLLQIID